MACPAGYTGDEHSSSPTKFEKPLIYPTIAPPILIQKYTNDAIYLLGGQFAILCQFAHSGHISGGIRKLVP